MSASAGDRGESSPAEKAAPGGGSKHVGREYPPSLVVKPVTVRRGRAPFDVSIMPPGSKSLTNRALLLAALANGTSRLKRALIDADDSERMMAALSLLGAEIEAAATGDVRVRGVGGRWKSSPDGVRVDLHNAGTATRFLAAAAALAPGPVTIDGNERMRQRPIAELGDALTRLGLSVQYLGSKGCPPIRVAPPEGGILDPGRPRRIDLPTTVSGQFVSALLLIAPWLPGGLTVRQMGGVTSAPYIQMTLSLLHHLGATVKYSEDLRVMRVGPPEGSDGRAIGLGLPAFEYAVEPDASSATYFWAAAALFAGATCRVMGLDAESLQGDAHFPELLGRMGAMVVDAAPRQGEFESGGAASSSGIAVRGSEEITPILADMSSMPDAAMTLASVACFATGTSVLRGLRTLRVKETDRIAAMQAELGKLGVIVTTPVAGDPNAITITPPPGGIDCSPTAAKVEFKTYDDHRMAMSLALIGLRRPNVTILDPGCVRKTYPGFWEDLAKITG